MFFYSLPNERKTLHGHMFSKSIMKKGLGIKPFCSIAEVWHLFVKILDKRLRTKIAHSLIIQQLIHIMHLLQDRHF